MHEAHQQSRQSRAEQVFVPSKAWVRQPLTQPWVPVVQKSTVVLTGVKVPSDDTSIEFETQLSCFVRAPEASLGKREALSLSGLRRAVRFDDTISEARYDEDKPASILDIVVPEPPGGNSAEPAVDTDASGLFDGLLRLENDNAVAHQLCPVNEDTLSVTTGVVLEPVILSGLVPTDATTEFNGYVAKPDQHIGRTEVPEEALKHWLTNGLLHGVLQHSPTTPCYEAPPSEDVFTDDPILPYLKEEASEMPLRAFTCKGSNEPLTNWLDTPAIAGTYRKTTTYAYVQAPALRDMFAESEDRVVTAADPAQIFKDLLRDSKRLSGVAVNDDDDCTQAAANDRRTEADSHGATIDEAKKDSFYKTESEAVRQDHSAASQDSDIPNDVDRDPEFSQIAVAEFSRVDGEKMANEQDDEYDDDDERSLSTPSDTVTGDSSPELVQQNHQEHQAESGKVMLNDEDWPLLISLAAQREE
ncbi:hypothetical protein BX666DRAFT_170167 [Dichotomocladium elegans]|nr:hypothetical protein BX666DRAFT_170167 [Dichotomocladium elegans]